MEALGREGKKEGQVMMVKNNDKVEAYQVSRAFFTPKEPRRRSL
jgi:phospholipase A-2-activating protein